ncbi:MAG: hypothetical protein AAF352_04835 [Pseudomonadota bacterium]
MRDNFALLGHEATITSKDNTKTHRVWVQFVQSDDVIATSSGLNIRAHTIGLDVLDLPDDDFTGGKIAINGQDYSIMTKPQQIDRQEPIWRIEIEPCN